MDGMQWLRESWRDTLALTEDWFESRDGKEDRAMANKTKTYEVVVSPPQSEQQTYTVVVADGTVLSAKAEASKLYYGHVFTGQFKYMRAKKVEISK